MLSVTNPAARSEDDAPPVPSISAEDIRRLTQLVEANGLSELLFETGDIKIVLRTAAFHPTVAPASVGPLSLTTTFPPLVTGVSELTEEELFEPTQEAYDEDRLQRVEAPIMGVFYRASSPNDPPIIEVGDVLTEGQVIGLIEAMKVFSEVPSPMSGRVVDIPAQNGALVQPGDVLVLLETE